MIMDRVFEDSKGLLPILLGGIMAAWQCKKTLLILEMHRIYG